jgi:hypothetical protein
MPHTQGPWIAERRDAAGCIIVDQEEPPKYGRVGIAIVRRASNADREVDANALLIAAAPDLLMALETLMIDLGEGNAHGRGLDMIPRATEKAARLAISKAKGTT